MTVRTALVLHLQTAPDRLAAKPDPILKIASAGQRPNCSSGVLNAGIFSQETNPY